MGEKQPLSVTGNWRITNLVDNHGVVYMRDDLKKEEPAMTAEIALGILLGVTVLVFIILVACACKQMNDSPQKEGGEAEPEGGEVELKE